MAKSTDKPPFTIVSGETIGISPPRPLGPHGMALWNAVLREYRIDDRGGVEILCQCCQALDRSEALAAAIERDGSVIYSRNGVPKVHPAVKDELACRAFVTRGLERLGLNIETIKPGARSAIRV
jgi:hypothetical protein